MPLPYARRRMASLSTSWGDKPGSLYTALRSYSSVSTFPPFRRRISPCRGARGPYGVGDAFGEPHKLN